MECTTSGSTACIAPHAQVALPFFVGAAIMAVLFPLFIIIACDVSPEQRAKQRAPCLHLS